MKLGEITLKIIQFAHENPNMTLAEVMQRLPGYHEHRVRNRIWSARNSGKVPKSFGHAYSIVSDQVEAEPISNHLKGIDGFRQVFDKSLKIPQKIRECIEKYLKEPGWMYDEDFRRICEIRHNDWRRYTKEFDHLQVRPENGVLVWGHPDIIDEMRKVVALGG